MPSQRLLRFSPVGRVLARFRAWSLPAVLVLMAAPAFQHQESPPRGIPGRFEVDGFDFRPDGAWRRETQRIRTARRGLLRAGALAALNRAAVRPGSRQPGGPAVGGSYFVPVVPITFRNLPAPFPASQYQSVLFANSPPGAPYSVRSYYTEASRGLLTIDGLVFGWTVADSSDVYYEDGCNGIGVLNSCPHGGVRLGELLLEGLGHVDDGSVDWGVFDNDGPDGLANSGDDDGVVDFVVFLQPEVDGACGTSNLWAHRYDLAVWNGGSAYVTRSPRRDATGQPIPGSFIQVRDYTLQSAVGGPGACSGDGIMPIGTVAHETGHALGLPDLYDTNLRAVDLTQGVGEWGIMGSGNYAQPYSPAGFEAWSLAELGWVVIDTLRQDRSVTLGPVATGDTVLYAAVPGTDEYFLLENRQALGSDTAQISPFCQFRTRSCAKGPGLLVWHIDQGQIDAHGFRQDNRVNSGPLHGVALVQADGLNQLRIPGGKNRGDAGDPWPGSSGATLFSPVTNPPALDNQGRSAGFVLDSIRQLAPVGPMAFRFALIPPGSVTVTLPGALDELLGRPVLGAAQQALLDSLGNGNGRYDVGDFLAYYRSHPAAGRLP
jgi:M6 family metalloprotease-like protein